MNPLRRPPDQARTAQDRLAALFAPPVRQQHRDLQPEPPQELQEQPGWELPPEEVSLPGAPAHPPVRQPTPAPPADAAPATPAPAAAAAAPPVPAGSERRGGVLPSPLRAGRWEPGRRGALALVVVAALAAVLSGTFVLRSRPAEVTAPPLLRPAAGVSAAPAGVVVVAVAGKVKRQGLVRLPLGARVDDALRAAGGVLTGADIGLLNLARVLVDGEQLLVGIAPQPGAETSPGPPVGGSGRAPAAGGRVDLNTASVSDLDALPGIGPVLAQAIVGWRTEHGRFASTDQLREVPGIGEAKYASLRDKVRV